MLFIFKLFGQSKAVVASKANNKTQKINQLFDLQIHEKIINFKRQKLRHIPVFYLIKKIDLFILPILDRYFFIVFIL